MLHVGTVVVGVQEVRRAAAFWMQALDYVPRDEFDDNWMVLDGRAPAARSNPGLLDQRLRRP